MIFVSTGEDLYRKGQATEEKGGKLKHAIAYYERSAEKGYFDASLRLGELYYEGGPNIKKNYSLSLKWLTEYLDEKNDVDQHTKLRIYSKICDMYTEGDGGLNKDYQEAYEWNIKCNELKVYTLEGTCCLYRIGKLFEQGDLANFQKNDEVALSWYEKCLHERIKIFGDDKNYDSGFITLVLKVARSYCDGASVQVDYDNAHYWYSIICSEHYAGEDYQNLGLVHQCGTYTIRKDYRKAVQCYTVASNRGILEAKNSLAELYKEGGYGIDKNTQEALKRFKETANNGLIIANYSIGLIYELQNNFSEARKYYMKAANDPNENVARLKIGKYYFQGLGVEPNNDIALQWLQEASYNGNSEADKYIEEIEEIMKALEQEISADIPNEPIKFFAL